MGLSPAPSLAMASSCASASAAPGRVTEALSRMEEAISRRAADGRVAAVSPYWTWKW